MWAGIDFGHKTAGTTVICFGDSDRPLDLIGTNPRQDADHFLLSMLGSIKPEFATIDAPLTLPLVYTYPDKGGDHFYRKVDRELKAMSPMFIGGITARAIRLKADAAKITVPLFETYPEAFVKHNGLETHYHKRDKEQLKPFLEQLLMAFPVKVTPEQVPDWSYADALICWMSAYRMAHDEHITFGDDEGQIFI